MLEISGKSFLETRPLPNSVSEGFPEGFAAIIAPTDGKRFSFESWATDNPVELARYVSKRGAAVVLKADIDENQALWSQSGSSLRRSINTEPHVENPYSSTLLFLAHRVGEIPRNIDTCVSAASPLAAATRTKALSLLKTCSKRFRPILENFIETKDNRDAVRELGLFSAQHATESDEGVLLLDEYLRFSTDIFSMADTYIFRYNGANYPGSVLVLDDAAFFEKREPVVHWKDNPRTLETLRMPCEGSSLWKVIFQVYYGSHPSS